MRWKQQAPIRLDISKHLKMLYPHYSFQDKIQPSHHPGEMPGGCGAIFACKRIAGASPLLEPGQMYKEDQRSEIKNTNLSHTHTHTQNAEEMCAGMYSVLAVVLA